MDEYDIDIEKMIEERKEKIAETSHDNPERELILDRTKIMQPTLRDVVIDFRYTWDEEDAKEKKGNG